MKLLRSTLANMTGSTIAMTIAYEGSLVGSGLAEAKNVYIAMVRLMCTHIIMLML